MVNRLRLGPEDGPFVTIDEDAGELKIDAPGDVDLQANTIINALFGDTDFDGSQVQNAALFGASLANALDANGQDITNAGQITATEVDATDVDATDITANTTTSTTVDSTDVNASGTTTTLDLVVNGSVTGIRQGLDDADADDVFTLPDAADTIDVSGIDATDITTTNINSVDVTVDAVNVNGTAIPLGGSVTLSAADVGAVDTTDFPDLQFNGTTVDSTDTINFIPE